VLILFSGTTNGQVRPHVIGAASLDGVGTFVGLRWGHVGNLYGWWHVDFDVTNRRAFVVFRLLPWVHFVLIWSVDCEASPQYSSSALQIVVTKWYYSRPLLQSGKFPVLNHNAKRINNKATVAEYIS
jgi:hypothetical protein